MGVKYSTQNSFANRRTDVLFGLVSQVQFHVGEHKTCLNLAETAVLCKVSRVSASGASAKWMIRIQENCTRGTPLDSTCI